MKIRPVSAMAAITLFLATLTAVGCRGVDLLEPNPRDLTGSVSVTKPPGDAPSKARRDRDDDDDRGGSRLPRFDRDDFVRKVDNRYFPLVPGTVYTYEGETDEGLETIKVEVTRDTRTILGVRTIVVRDRVYLDGSLIEDTFDWYAQDEDGNVWYFGEDTKEIEDGVVVSTEGSWRAGVDGAEPGIVMLADPQVGDTYAQENAPGVAEDRARVVSLNRNVKVPYGKFRRVLQTFDDTPLDPTALEDKYYAPGVGLVLEVAQPDGERVELVSVKRR